MGTGQMFTELPTGEINCLSQARAWLVSIHLSFLSPEILGGTDSLPGHPHPPIFPMSSHILLCMFLCLGLVVFEPGSMSSG